MAWERRLKPWDIAAGLIIVKEAGAFAESITPGQDILKSGEMITASPAMFDQLAKVIRG